jgi:hypothetical protein
MNSKDRAYPHSSPTRRDFVKTCLIGVGSSVAIFRGLAPNAAPAALSVIADDFDRPDELYHGDGWESLNPGYWKVEGGKLRRRLHNIGDRARETGFPYHWETHQDQPMPTQYDASLPFGMIWRRDWNLRGNYQVRLAGTIEALPTAPQLGEEDWAQHRPGYSLIGICFGAKTLYEGWRGNDKSGAACWYAAWRDNGLFGIYSHSSDQCVPVTEGAEVEADPPTPGQEFAITLQVEHSGQTEAALVARLDKDINPVEIRIPVSKDLSSLSGYVGVVGRGLLDVSIDTFSLDPWENEPVPFELNELQVCYPLGDSLREDEGGRWTCRMIALCRSGGEKVAVRISDSEEPAQGWIPVSVAGEGKIVSNDFRLNTALIDVILPHSPSEKEMYYTVWKDGVDVTRDPREGFLGRKDYVGRLPKLTAPYRLCGLSCHAIHGGKPQLPNAGWFQENWIYEQPTPEAYRHLEDYEFQVMLWEDDVWYLELLLYPPSTDDAYKIVTTTIAGPTSRWQMMRHWNVLNPGDHDHGMDDVKGPEQISIRKMEGLGQDPDYMRRNFQMVSHLMTGEENPDPLENPKRWRAWRMPNRDFTLMIMDARLWRTTQETHLWAEWGWGGKGDIYDREDPTRTLLGEEQYAWLQESIATDCANLICLTGINSLHTIWSGWEKDAETGLLFTQRDRVAADYAGWVKAGCDRVIELLGNRSGVISVYGDVHNGSIIRNKRQRLIEASFGPIGRYGGRAVKEDWAPEMVDYDGREISVLSLYHQTHGTPDLQPRTGPEYYNFLEMAFDPTCEDPSILLKLRNLIDSPSEEPRGGGWVEAVSSETGRPPMCQLPRLEVWPEAECLLLDEEGRPVRGFKAFHNGGIPVSSLPDIPPGRELTLVIRKGEQAEARHIQTLPL